MSLRFFLHPLVAYPAVAPARKLLHADCRSRLQRRSPGQCADRADAHAPPSRQTGHASLLHPLQLDDVGRAASGRSVERVEIGNGFVKYNGHGREPRQARTLIP